MFVGTPHIAILKVIKNITEKLRESMFVRSKEKLVKKFDTLQNNNKSKGRLRNTGPYKCTKDPVLNLYPEDIPYDHQDTSVKDIPYMDIVSTTKWPALKLEYKKKISEAQNPRKDVLRILKLAKPVKGNLTRRQSTAAKEIKKDEEINIYPYEEQDLIELKKWM